MAGLRPNSEIIGKVRKMEKFYEQLFEELRELKNTLDSFSNKNKNERREIVSVVSNCRE